MLQSELERLNKAARGAVPDKDIEVLFDEMPVCRIGEVYVPQPELASTPDPNWQRIATLPQKFLRDVDDYWFHVYKPNAGDVIVDIGAGRGEDVYAFSKAVGPSGHVWAIEPHPVSFAALRKLCELNGLTNVTTLNFACTEMPADLQIETLPIWESNYVRSGEATATSHSVRGVPFDSLAQERGIDRIDFLKMNIEGAERMALPGCREALQRSGAVCVAAHDFRADRGEGDHFRTLEFVRAYLRDSGFQLVTRDEDPRYYVPYHVHGIR